MSMHTFTVASLLTIVGFMLIWLAFDMAPDRAVFLASGGGILFGGGVVIGLALR